jgi:hypothetical protein
MNLDEGQKKKVAAWVGEGMKLAEIQKRIASEFNISLTYMDVRFLVDDLKLTLKDPDPPKVPTPAASAPTPSGLPPDAEPPPSSDVPAGAPLGSKVLVTVDAITRAGAVVSGKVTFTDGNTADWYLDQTGRLGFAPKQQGYRPPAADVQQFQAALDAELRKLGF